MLSYRKDIEGLRGIAVLLVILFHYKIPGFEAGFVGVDIFFVISGYLIAAIILSELQEGAFSFAEFYKRRVLRILPPLYVVVFVSLLFSFYFLDSDFVKSLAKTSASAVLLSSNVFFYQALGPYFAEESGANILLHTWSLSLEEQFYIFFPLLIYAVHKYAPKYRMHWIIGLALVSLGMSIAMTPAHPVFAFYLPFTRCWEFLAGMLAAADYRGNKGRLYPEAWSAAGVLLLVSGLIRLNTESYFPYWNALFPVAGTALLLRYSHHTRIVSGILSFRPLLLIGKISYSLYLWHWPVLVLSEYFIYDMFRGMNLLIPLSLTVLLSVISWRYVEQPFRLKKRTQNNRKRIFGGALFFSICLAGIALIIAYTPGFPDRTAENKTMEAIKADTSWSRIWRYHAHTIRLGDHPDDPLATIGDTSASPTFLLWGDSHAGSLLYGFEAACLEKKVSGYVAIVTGDAPILPITSKPYLPDLAAVSGSVIRFIRMHPGIQKVFLSARWTTYRHTSERKNGQGLEYPFDEEVSRIVDTLVRLNREVVIIAPTPELNMVPRKYFFQSRILHKDINSLTPTYDQFLQYQKGFLDLMAKLDQHSLVSTVDPAAPFFHQGHLLLLDEGHLTFLDAHHLSQWGSLKLKKTMLDWLPSAQDNDKK